MSKPNWNNAPSWAKYLAMDEDGSWWWHERMPVLKNGTWNQMPLMAGYLFEEAKDHLPDHAETLEPRP